MPCLNRPVLFHLLQTDGNILHESLQTWCSGEGAEYRGSSTKNTRTIQYNNFKPTELQNSNYSRVNYSSSLLQSVFHLGKRVIILRQVLRPKKDSCRELTF
jgi:O-acetylhomoserine/O-acetylserine sulfhydrylase-like pyridoxal-dependent enzyme